MADTFYSRLFKQTAPGLARQEEERASANADLEGQVHPSGAPAPLRAPQWTLDPTGVFSRRVPERGVVQRIRNEGGTVISSEEPYTPPPVSPDKPFAETLIADIPKRIELLSRKLAAGDIPGAQAERAQVETFIADNAASLHRFTRYNGSDPLTSMSAKAALSLVSGNWLSNDQKLAFDPKLNPMSAGRDAMVRGYGPAGTRALEAARYGDGPSAEQAAAVLRYGGEGEAQSYPSASGGKRVSGALPPVSDGSFEDWARHTESSMSTLKSSVPADVLSQAVITPEAIIGRLHSGFLGGDAFANGIVSRLAAQSVSENSGAAPSDNANVLLSSLDAGASALHAFRSSTPREADLGGKVLSGIKGLLPGPRFSQQSVQIGRAMQDTRDNFDIANSAGIDLSRVLPQLGRAMYRRSFMPGTPAATPEDAHIDSVLNSAGLLSDRVTVTPSFAPGVAPAVDASGGTQEVVDTVSVGLGKKAPSITDGLQLLHSLVSGHVKLSGLKALETGGDLSSGLRAREADLASSLGGAYGLSSEEASAAAKLVNQTLERSEGEEIDLRRLPDMLRASAVTSGVIKAAPAASPTGSGVAASPKTAIERLELVAAARAASLTQDPKRAAEIASGDTDVNVVKGIQGADTSARNFNPLDIRAGDQVAVEKAFSRATDKIPGSLLSPTGPMLQTLYKGTPIKDLGTEETLNKAVSAMMDEYRKMAPVTFSSSRRAILEAGFMSVARRASNWIKSRLSDAPEGSSRTAEDLLGALPPSAENEIDLWGRRDASGALQASATGALSPALAPFEAWRATALGAGVVPDLDAESVRDTLSRSLSSAYFADVRRDYVEREKAKGASPSLLGVQGRGFGFLAKERALNDALSVHIPEAASTAESVEPSVNIGLAGISGPEVRLGLAALQHVVNKATRPINDALKANFLRDLPNAVRGLPYYQAQAVRAAVYSDASNPDIPLEGKDGLRSKFLTALEKAAKINQSEEDERKRELKRKEMQDKADFDSGSAL